MNRPRTWEEDRRQRKKELEKRNWFRKGGYQIPLFAPHTPGGELVKRMKKKEAENNQGRRVRFKIVGKRRFIIGRNIEKVQPMERGEMWQATLLPL